MLSDWKYGTALQLFALLAYLDLIQCQTHCMRTLENHRYSATPTLRLTGVDKDSCERKCHEMGTDKCRSVVFYGTRRGSNVCELFDKRLFTGSGSGTRNARGSSVVAPGSSVGAAGYGSWAQWGSWSGCSSGGTYVPSGGGAAGGSTQYESRTRTCPSYVGCGGGANVDTKPCQPAAQWSQWSQWAGCSATCGDGGTRTRTRTCQPSGGNCVGQSSEMQPCPQLPACETCAWGQWQSWTSCSATCGTGYQSRTRDQMAQGTGNAYGGNQPCPGDSTDSGTCNAGPCASWSQWTPWTPCTASCGTGTQTRTRDCQPPGASCPGDSYDSKSCDQGECCQWGRWSQWSQCSASCGSGQKQRTRTQLSQSSGNPYAGNQPCPGDSADSGTCDAGPCASWSQWTPWTPCTATCGTGQQTRTRDCNPPGGSCPGDSYDSKTCDQGECCQWGRWSQWSQCSVSCGSGQKQRQRNPLGTESLNPYSGANPCPGDSNELTNCQAGPCAQWSQWSQWSSCSASCGGSGQQTRYRTCQPAGGNCVGQSQGSKTCSSSEQCCSWGQWSAYSACSVTCGDGSQARQRVCSCGYGGGCSGGSGSGTQPCSLGPCSGYANAQQFSQFYANRLNSKT